MCTVMWRWASEVTGLPLTDNHLLYSSEDNGDGDGFGNATGGGWGEGTHLADWDNDPVDYDQFDFRIGRWRHQ